MAKKEKNKILSAIYNVQDAIMLQAENNKIGLTEFSNNKIFLIHSMMKVSLHFNI